MLSGMNTLIIIVKQLLQALWVIPRELLLLVWLLLKTVFEALVIVYHALSKAFGGKGRTR